MCLQIALAIEQDARPFIDRTAPTCSSFDAKTGKAEGAEREIRSLVLDPNAMKQLLSGGW